MTETRRHPVDLALRAMTTTFEPSPADFELSRVKLMDAISAASPPSSHRIRIAWATAVALLLVFAVSLIQTASTSPAAALITELAEVAEVTDPLVIPDDQFAYFQTDSTGLVEVGPDALGGVDIEHDSLFYSLPQTRESWIGNQGTVRLRTHNLPPVFFSVADEAAYYTAGLDEGDHIGEAIVKTQPDTNRILDERDWPTDPVELEATIRSVVGEVDGDVLLECLSLIREPLIPPELRTAVLRVIAGLDLELVEESPDGAGTFSTVLEGYTAMRLTFTLDATGHLRFEELILVDGDPDRGVPPGTAEYTANYTVPRLVDSADLP